MVSALVGRHVPQSVAQSSSGPWRSPGGGGTRRRLDGVELAGAARTAFMSGNEVALAVGAIVALAAAVLVLVALPSQASPAPPSSAEPDQ